MLVPDIYSDFWNSFFDGFGDAYNAKNSVSKNTAFGISTDVMEYDDRYELDMDLPGFKKEDIQVELKEGYLTVSAKHNDETEKKSDGGKYIYKERTYGESKRTFYVGKGITKEQIRAGYENGVLKLSVPKEDQSKKVEENHFIPIEG